MDAYPNNSNRFKEESKKEKKEKTEVVERKVEKVTTGGVRTKKKSKIVDSFISEDIADVKNYLIGDILIPTFGNSSHSFIILSVKNPFVEITIRSLFLYNSRTISFKSVRINGSPPVIKQNGPPYFF